MARLERWNPPKFEHTRAVHGWHESHAPFVHNGVTRLDGSKMPARPWVDRTLSEIDVKQLIANEIKKAGDISKGFHNANLIIAQYFQMSIESPEWEWDRETRRKNGEIVLSPRNIVDLGNLRDSQDLKMF